jgi:hypothetical protein
VERTTSSARREGADVCDRSRRIVLNWAGATLAEGAMRLDPFSFRLTDALAKNGVFDLGTDDIAISKDQRKLITDGDDLEAKSVMAITSVGANARTHGLL